MSQDPTDESTERADRETRTDYAYDDWPVEGRDAVDDTTAPARGTTATVVGASPNSVVLYDENENRLFEAKPDEDERRLVPKEGSERELGPSETLGDALEELGERLEWDSLSEFARDRLQDDPDGDRNGPADRDRRTDRDEPGTPSGTASFTRSNVAGSKPHDAEFTGSYTYRDPDDQAFVVERFFLVTFDDPDDPREAEVEVIEHVLRAEEPQAERRAGDAEPVRKGTDRFELEFDSGATTSDRKIENLVEERCREWHEARPEPIA